nr:DNA primase [Cryptomonas sp.]
MLNFYFIKNTQFFFGSPVTKISNTKRHVYIIPKFIKSPKRFILRILCKNEYCLSDVIGEYGIKLDKKEKSFVGLCPFHIEKTPSFHVNDEKGVYHCFGCGASGNIESFIKKKGLKLNFSRKKNLFKNYELGIKEKNFFEKYNERFYLASFKTLILIQIASKYYEKLLDISKMAKIYFFTRGISLLTAKIYRLGYSNANREVLSKLFKNYGFKEEQIIETGLVNRFSGMLFDIFQNRLVIPILNKEGIIIGFGGRLLNNTKFPKYLNSYDSPIFKKNRCLFADYNFSSFNKTKPKISVLVEGYMDSVILMQNGFRISTASLGTGVNRYHLTRAGIIVRNNHVIFSFDNDQAGKKAIQKSFLDRAKKIIKNELKISVSSIPNYYNYKDPDEFSYFRGVYFYTIETINNSIPGLLWIEYSFYNFHQDIALFINKIISGSIVILLNFFENLEIDNLANKFFITILRNDSIFKSKISYFFSRNILEHLVGYIDSNEPSKKKNFYIFLKNKREYEWYGKINNGNIRFIVEKKLVFLTFFFQMLNEDIYHNLFNCSFCFSKYSGFLFQKYQTIILFDVQMTSYEYYWKEIYLQENFYQVLLQNTDYYYIRILDFQKERLFEMNITSKIFDNILSELTVTTLLSKRIRAAKNLSKIHFKQPKLNECLFPGINDFYNQSKKKLKLFQEQSKKRKILINQIDYQIDLIRNFKIEII